MSLERGLIISGQIYDADTNEPITNYRIQKGYWHEDEIQPRWHDLIESVKNNKGVYRITSDRTEDLVLKVYADGYLPVESPAFPIDEGGGFYDFYLEKAAIENLVDTD